MVSSTAALVAVALAASSSAASLRTTLRTAVGAKLGGPVNCGYKCGLMWNQRQDWGSGFNLNEYTACLEGCEKCNGGENDQCMSECKSESWITYLYFFNSVTKELQQIENYDIAAPLTQCLDGCVASQYPNPGNGGGFDGNLPKPFTDCTQQCYNTHLAAVSSASIARCQDGASATCANDELGCYTEEACGIGIVKGVVEPDKACIQGCSQNLCQAGAGCNGKGFWIPGGTPDTRGCQLITPQTMGVRETIKPTYYNQQSDLGDCCNAALQRCAYAPGVGGAAFGESLGRVIGENQCLDQSNGAPYKGASGKAIVMPKRPWDCNCQTFKDTCGGTLGLGADFACYGTDL